MASNGRPDNQPPYKSPYMRRLDAELRTDRHVLSRDNRREKAENNRPVVSMTDKELYETAEARRFTARERELVERKAAVGREMAKNRQRRGG